MTQEKIKTVCVDKVAYEAVLRNSIKVNDLEAENQQLKKLLTDICCELVDDEEDMTNGLLQYFNTDVIDRINEMLGEKK